MTTLETMAWLGKQAAEYHRSFILPPKRQSSQSKRVKIQHGQPTPTPDISSQANTQPAQRFGMKVRSGGAPDDAD